MKTILNNRSLLKISGSDAETFLQSQFSNDISKLDNTHAQLNAYCQHQGKVISLFCVMRYDGSFLLSFPADLAEKVTARLEMFVIMSDVSIENVSGQLIQIGLKNESHPNAYSINDNLSLIVDSRGDVNTDLNADFSQEWTKACIDYHIPEVFLSSSEKFVPQMLNLDINEIGVNFSKGCYPGQEVVARLHYLGEAKRRLFSFKSDSEIQIGDSLYCASSKTAKDRKSVV